MASKVPESSKHFESLFKTVRVTQHISLPPSYIGRMGKGITEILNRKILKYFTEYGGFVLAYSKPLVLSRVAHIIDETPNLHFDIQVDLYLFTPLVGALLSGTVNHVINENHVGCLVYNCFNASVQRRQTPTKNGIKRGEKIWFKVISLETISGVLCIQGEEVSEGRGSGDEQVVTNCSSKQKDNVNDLVVVSEDEHCSKRKGKKKKKRKRDEIDQDTTTCTDEKISRLPSALKREQSVPSSNHKAAGTVEESTTTQEVDLGTSSPRKHKHKKAKKSSKHEPK